MNKKEKVNKEIRIRIQPSLYEQLLKISENEYKNFSEFIRNIIVEYLKEAK